MFKNVNKVVKRLILIDFFTNSAFGSFMPLLAIFITRQIADGSAQVAGFAVSVFWIVKSFFQLPIARFLDRTDGERDDFWAMFLGYFFSGFIPILYIFVETPTQLYAVQAIYGFLMAWAVPSWYGIFTRHVDKWRISFEWSLQSVFSVGTATAFAAALGGYLADHYGFRIIFLFAGLISILISLLFLTIRKEMLPRRGEEKILPERNKDRL
ncbi:MAG: MFS transporter [Patescibacteria group bacterium]